MKRILIFVIGVLIIQSCARKGNPTGGPKDEDAPIIIETFPKINTTEFNSKEIKIYFDEYVKLKDLQKQLIVSPPLKYPAQISPQGIPTKRILIKIKDTLKPNTTYVFNFGNSIEDNNEGNVLSDFKYVFSTGKIIDTLELKGKIKDAFYQKTPDFISVLLYKAKNFNDSIVFNQKPDYVTNTLDTTNFKLTNLKAGTYKIIALKESNVDYQYQPKDEKIGFIDSIITIPNDKELILNIFKKEPKFQIKNISEISKGHLLFAYEGDATNSNIKVIKIDTLPKEKITDFKSFQYKEKNADSIHYFYVYKKMDSIKFRITKDTINQEILTKIFSKKTDSLVLSKNIKNTLHPMDTLAIVSTIPIKEIVKDSLQLMEFDTIPIAFNIQKKNSNQLQIIFNRKPKTKYKLSVLPKAITSIFEQTNDSLKFNFNTKKESYYSSINITFTTDKKPLIVQLLNNKNDIIQTKYLTDKKEISFEKLLPNKYKIRVIFDKNNNKKWDTGNFIKHQQPEPVFYFNKTIDLKENWILNENMKI